MSQRIFEVYILMSSLCGAFYIGCEQIEVESSPRAHSLQDSDNDHKDQNLDARLSIVRLTKDVLKRCSGESLHRCTAWSTLHMKLTSDLRMIVINAPYTTKIIDHWVDRALELLLVESPTSQALSAELLLVISKRTKFRYLSVRKRIRGALEQRLSDRLDPLFTARLLIIFHELAPLGSGEIFKKFTSVDRPPEVQEVAWRIIAQRHSVQEPVQLSSIKRAMRDHESLMVKASLIRAISVLKNSRVIRWCGHRWWENELYVPCREALTLLGNERASRELWKWVKAMFHDLEQALNADRQLAEALIILSRATHSGRSEKRYKKLLDRFFSRRRSESAAIKVADSWLHLSSKRLALELSLRYLRATTPNIVSQSHFFEEHLRKVVYQLSYPSQATMVRDK